MLRSTERILTTHVGSLPRPSELVQGFRTMEGQALEDCLRDMALRIDSSEFGFFNSCQFFALTAMFLP